VALLSIDLVILMAQDRVLTGTLQAPQISPAGPPPPQARQIPIGTGEITGTVTAADTGRPIRDAFITLSGSSDVTPASRGGRGSAASGAVGNLPLPGLSLSRTTLTDSDGRFRFDRLPPGRYGLNASRQPFLPTSYGQRAPGRQGTLIEMRDGQRLNLAVRLIRSSVMSGTVLAEDGEPLFGARIQAYRYQFVNGFRRLSAVNGASTDDRGTYRLSNLQPGEYIVAATPGQNEVSQRERVMAERAAFEQAVASAATRGGGAGVSVVSVMQPAPSPDAGAGYAPTYFPGTPMIASASTITIEAGVDRAGVDIHVQPVRAGNIRGSVIVPADLKAAVQIQLASRDPQLAGVASAGTRVNPDGSFVLRNVTPGEYILQAFTVAQHQPQPAAVGGPAGAVRVEPLQTAERLWARTLVAVEGDSTVTVELSLRPGRSISGVVVFESTRPPDSGRGRMTAMITPAPTVEPNFFSGPQPQAPVGTDGRFTIDGVLPGRYFLRVNGQLKSAIVDGVDTLDFPLDLTGDRDITDAVLTVADHISELTGRLTEVNGEPGYNYTIVVAADDSRYWTPGSRRIAIARPGAGGQFRISNLPLGGYHLAAVTDFEPGSQYDPVFLKELASASMRVTINEGGRQVQDIRVAGQ
jgi:protocatechuate 3,4-dioxygenase beta subunit